ncbi:MAG: hypothetical protein NTY12_01100 [Candidatus Falkowbacteria bacterium]|nr:hypothetical protein [Candidatus Falkowbacteria bacterium]
MKLNNEILKEINLALSVSLGCLLVLETLWPGSVLAYINLNYWLISWVLSVILLLFSSNSKDNLHDRINH